MPADLTAELPAELTAEVLLELTAGQTNRSGNSTNVVVHGMKCVVRSAWFVMLVFSFWSLVLGPLAVHLCTCGYDKEPDFGEHRFLGFRH